MECALLLNVVVRERTVVLELLAGKDQTLLVWRNALLVLDLGLDVGNRVGALDVQRDGLACRMTTHIQYERDRRHQDSKNDMLTQHNGRE